MVGMRKDFSNQASKEERRQQRTSVPWLPALTCTMMFRSHVERTVSTVGTRILENLPSGGGCTATNGGRIRRAFLTTVP
jgi:hypothetical protein